MTCPAVPFPAVQAVLSTHTPWLPKSPVVAHDGGFVVSFCVFLYFMLGIPAILLLVTAS